MSWNMCKCLEEKMISQNVLKEHGAQRPEGPKILQDTKHFSARHLLVLAVCGILNVAGFVATYRAEDVG